MQVLGLAFRVGLGGRIGSGRQYWPWIGVDDQIGAMIHLLGAEVRGPVNLTGPEPVTNVEFTRTLGRIVHRPTVLPLPGPLLILGLRDFGRTNVVGGQRAVPTKLLASGYQFRQSDLEEALRAALHRS